MIGIGTQEDPFRPTNWDEFVTVIGHPNVYIECPENDVWDMLEILPDGLKSIIKWANNTIHGNGLIIKNLYFNPGYYFDLDGYSNNHDIYKLNFLNMAYLFPNRSLFAGGTTFYKNTKGSGVVYFRNCKFSGAYFGGAPFNAYQKRMFLTYDEEKSCSMSFRFSGDSSLFGALPEFRNCYIEFDGDNMEGGSSNYTTFEKCYLKGKIPPPTNTLWKNNSFYGDANILDLEISEGVVLTTTSSAYSYFKNSVLNIDKMYGSYSDTRYNYIKATTEQLSDVAYLQSQGFSISDDDNVDTYAWTVGANGNPTNKYLPDPITLGAFANATNLAYVRIPPTVKKIGRYSFRNTKLTSVTIASDCEYYDTSFPDGCQIKFY